MAMISPAAWWPYGQAAGRARSRREPASHSLLVIGPRGIPNSEGGVEKYATSVLPRLVQHGFRVTVACMKQFTDREDFQGVRIVRFTTRQAFLTDKHLYLLSAVGLVLRERPDSVLLLGTAAATLTAPLRLLGIRVYARCGLFDQLSNKWGSLARVFIHLANAQLRFAHGVIAVSQNIASQLSDELGVRHVTVIPNGLDAVQRGEGKGALAEERYVLAVGRVTVQKDVLTLVQAFKAAALPGVRLVIAGASDGSLKPAEIDELKHFAITWRGYVGRAELDQLYAGAALFVNSSIVEGMSNAVLEAISHGCPVLLSDIPANREVPAPERSYFPVGDVGTLSGLLGAALQSPREFVADKSLIPDWDMVAAMTAGFIRRGTDSKAQAA